MIPTSFSALLKTEDDKMLEVGYASVSEENRSVDFKNEFVPLMKLGETVKIVRIVENKETHCFIGNVYLSSKGLLRIVSVKDYLLSDYEKNIATDIIMAGEVSLPNSEKFINVNIYSISLNTIKFMSVKEFDVRETFILKINDPIFLNDIIIEVRQIISFGDKFIGHRCNIISMSDESYSLLSKYMEEINIVFSEKKLIEQ